MNTIEKTLICAFAAGAILAVKAEDASGGSSETVWPVTTGDGTVYNVADNIMTISVPAGKTNDVAAAHLSSLLDNTVTNVTKLGRGSLVMNVDILAYKGDIFVKEGTWRVVDSNGLGKHGATAKGTNVGLVRISDGATLEAKCAANPKFLGKRVFVSGYGVDGQGALLANGKCGSMTWGSNITLEGDTYANSISTDTWYNNMAHYQAGGYMTFNGHDFIVSGVPSPTTGKAIVVFSKVNTTDIGRVVVTNETVFQFQGLNNFLSTEEGPGEIVINPGCSIRGQGWYGRMEWDVDWKATGYLNPGTYTTADSAVTNRCCFHGAFRIADSLRLVIPDNGGFGLFGPVSGEDVYIELQVTADVPPTNRLWIANGNNTFSGDVFFRNIELVIPVDGALPADDVSVEMRDCNITFTNVTYSLPDVMFTNNPDRVFSGGTGSWRSFVKNGPGTIIWDSGVGAGTFVLNGGVVRLELSDGRAGLLEPDDSGLPGFGKLVFPSTSGTLDVAGLELEAEDVDGFPVVTSSSDGGKFVICGGWTLDANDILAGKKATGVPLAFGAGSEFVVKNPNVLKETLAFMQPGKWLIAESSVAVAGCPSVEEPALARNWRVSVEGNKVYLKYYPSGTVISIR